MTDNDLAMTLEAHRPTHGAYDLQVEMARHSLIFNYRGAINHELMRDILQLSDTNLRLKQASVRKKRNIINILIECLQNMLNHGSTLADDEDTPPRCVVSLGHEQDCYVIRAGNPIELEQMARLKERLERITPMAAEQIHQLYLEQMARAEASDHSGAGLGILRMLRESNQNFTYHFDVLDERMSYFSIEVKVYA